MHGDQRTSTPLALRGWYMGDPIAQPGTLIQTSSTSHIENFEANLLIIQRLIKNITPPE